MFFSKSAKIVALASIALHLGLSVVHAQPRGVEAQVITGNPPGLLKKLNLNIRLVLFCTARQVEVVFGSL